jgi:hypothetical protein
VEGSPAPAGAEIVETAGVVRVGVAVDVEVFAGDKPFADLVLEHAEVVNAKAASNMMDTRRRVGKS